jgi:hypothetical protein
VSKDFWPMWGLFLLFIIFAAGMTYWGGYEPYALFWVIVGVVGSVFIGYIFRNGAKDQR